MCVIVCGWVRRFQYPVEWKISNKPGASALFEVCLPTYALHVCVGGGGGVG